VTMTDDNKRRHAIVFSHGLTCFLMPLDEAGAGAAGAGAAGARRRPGRAGCGRGRAGRRRRGAEDAVTAALKRSSGRALKLKMRTAGARPGRGRGEQGMAGSGRGGAGRALKVRSQRR
jgi:hypothetical protein